MHAQSRFLTAMKRGHFKTSEQANSQIILSSLAMSPNRRFFFLFFPGCSETLTGINGSFHSPNYSRNYTDGQYCSWRITVNPAQQIHLMFTNFSLQSENNTDALYVYDGENATGKVLGVFCGSHPPPEEGIYSSSNHMFVIFKSNRSGSYTGFEASYCEKSCFGECYCVL